LDLDDFGIRAGTVGSIYPGSNANADDDCPASIISSAAMPHLTGYQLGGRCLTVIVTGSNYLGGGDGEETQRIGTSGADCADR
jgi:hypothetical protein